MKIILLEGDEIDNGEVFSGLVELYSFLTDRDGLDNYARCHQVIRPPIKSGEFFMEAIREYVANNEVRLEGLGAQELRTKNLTIGMRNVTIYEKKSYKIVGYGFPVARGGTVVGVIIVIADEMELALIEINSI